MTEPLATTKQVAEFLNVEPGTLRDWRSDNYGPPYYKISYREVRYDMAEVRAWLESQRQGDPAEDEPAYTATQWTELIEATGEKTLEDALERIESMRTCEHEWTPGEAMGDYCGMECDNGCRADAAILVALRAPLELVCGTTIHPGDMTKEDVDTALAGHNMEDGCENWGEATEQWYRYCTSKDCPSNRELIEAPAKVPAF